MYYLCYKKVVAPTVHVEDIRCDFISDVDELKQANDRVLNCQKSLNQIKYIEEAYDEFIKYKSTIRKPAMQSDITLERLARSFFLEFDVFLNHWKKYMSRRGKKKEFESVFNKATHDALDSSDDYALASMLRNYIAHSADVVQGTFWGGVGVYDVGCSKNLLTQNTILNVR